MKARYALGAAALLTSAAFAANAAGDPSPAQPAAHLVQGKQVYDEWCAPCHTDSPGLAGTLALQTKYEGQIPAVLEHRTDLTPEVVEFFVRNGVAWMAPFRRTEISDAELAGIGAYLAAPLEERGLSAAALAKAKAANEGAGQ